MDDGREDVVILNEDDSPMELGTGGGEAASGSTKAVIEKKPKKRMSAASRMSRIDGPRVWMYDELIEGGDRVEVAFPDDLDFQFEIPPEVEDIEVK